MAIDFYSITLFVHILAVFTWLATIPIDVIQQRVINFIEDTEAGLKALGFSNLNSRLTAISMILILLTGAYMSGENWFNFKDNFGWLAVKQIIFFLLVTAYLYLFFNQYRKLNDQIKSEKINEGRETLRILRRFNHTFSLFIIINIFLAVTKPF